MKESTLTRLLHLLLLPAALLLGAADRSDTVIAQRGEVRVTVADVERMLATMDPATQLRIRATPAALSEVVRDRVLRDALLLEARGAKWDVRPDIASRAEDARIQVIVQSFIAHKTLPVADPSEADILQSYEASKARLTVPRQYNLSQIAILVPATANRDQEEEARRKILSLRAEAMKPKVDFAELARKTSQDQQTAEKGGELGWTREDVLLPAIRAVVPTMKDGTISDPIRGPDAWHIVRLSGTRPAGVMPLEQAREGIVQALRQAHAQAAARAFIQEMVRVDPIQVNEIELLKQFSAPGTTR